MFRTTRGRLVISAMLLAAALLLLLVSALSLVARPAVRAAAPTATTVALAPEPTATATATATATPRPTPTSTAAPTVTPTRAATRAPSPTAAGPVASPVAMRQAFSTEQLAADYALVLQALAERDPAPRLYAVAVIFDGQATAAETQFLLLSSDGGLLYSYKVTGDPRTATERALPQAITPDATFTPYPAVPWKSDPDWLGYVDQGAALLERDRLAPASSITKITMIGRTGVDYNWMILYDTTAGSFRYIVRGGDLNLVR
ncbi:MAG TPA: hypothetical protein VFW96_02310 [Thermomicrobiales bacterium]|nr:hypothetical protein [Thermomicrobiales bacterium]